MRAPNNAELMDNVVSLMLNRFAAYDLLNSDMSDRGVLDRLRREARRHGLTCFVDEAALSELRQPRNLGRLLGV